MKYVVMTLPEPTEKTPEQKVEERLAAYRAAGMDDHSLNIYRFRMEREDRHAQEQPIFLGRRHGPIILSDSISLN
jgi:hypothetical protein